MNNEILFKPNGLILATANKTVTSTEYKIYDTLLQRCQVTKDEHWRKAEISRKELRNIVKSNDNSTVEELKKILEKFMSVKIRFKLGRKHYGATLLADYIYDEDEDAFTCSMSENVYMALMHYTEFGYSPIDIKLVKRAKGFYTQKIYQLLRMWSRQNKQVTKEFTIEQIKEVCDIVEGTSYDLYKAFKNRVLIPAIKEINEKLNMQVTFNEIKSGRRVTKIEFTFTDFETRNYDFKQEEMIIEPGNVEESDVDNRKKIFEEYGMKPIAISTLEKLEKEYGIELLEKAICIMGENNKKKKVGAPVKYLTSVLSNLKENDSSINPKSFVNFEPGTSDEKLQEIEEELLYGSENDGGIEENNDLPDCLKKYLKNE